MGDSLYDYCIKTGQKELLQQWIPERNGALTPQSVPYGSHQKIWWRCDKGHEWQAVVKSRTQGSGCPYCTGRKVLPGFNDLATTHPHLVKQWHPTKNQETKPTQVVAGTIKQVWWRCDKGHEWQAQIASRAYQAMGCPVCAGKVIIPGENDLASAFPEIAERWHPEKNGNLSPQMVSPYSNKKTWWQCEKGHEYYSLISSRTEGKGCPYCTGTKVLPGFNDLTTLEPKVAAQWHPAMNGNLTPEMVTTGSHRRVWWECQNGHVWKAVIYSRARDQKVGCPVCAGRVSEEKQERYRSMMTDL